MDNRRCTWARAVVVALLCLAGAAPAFAQAGGGTGILTGTVVDSTGAALPGATVNATEANTGSVRTAASNDSGVFRIPALNPGRYALSVELASFKTVTVVDISLLSSEIRDLGRLTLEIGGLTETVSVTSEVTPVQTASSQLQRTVTGEQLTMIQVKGRDIFGMMKILPGVVDTTFSRDFASWSSGRGLSINGGNSLNKNTTIDGVPVGEEGGDGTTHITPNIDAIGQVTVITSGYTAENGRQSSGLISIVTKSGTSQFRGSGWYNARRDEWNSNDYLRIKQGASKPFFEVNISGYSIGGPVVIPKLIDSRAGRKKVFFFLSQEFTDDIRPTAVTRTNLPTALERAGDFSQTRRTSTNPAINGTLQVIIDPLTGQPFPGNVIPPERFHAMGVKMLNLLPLPNGILNRAVNQEWTSNDAQDVTPIHKRKNFVMRVDTVLGPSMRFSTRALFDRDDSITFNRVAPGIGSVNNMFPGDLLTAGFTHVLSDSMVNEATAGFSHNHWGFRVGTGSLNPADYTDMYRQNIGLDPPRLEPYGPYGAPHLGRIQTDEYPYLPDMLYSGGDRSGLGSYRPSGGNGPLPRRNENYRYTFQDDLSWTRGRHNLKFGFFIERDSKTEPGSNNYNGVYNFGHSADNPLSTGNGYANALLGVFTSYTELTNRIDAEVRHWQADGYAQDSWRITPRMTPDHGLPVTHAGAVYEARNMNSAFDPKLWDPRQAAILYRPVCTTGVAGNQACSAANRRAIDPRNPGVFLSQAYAGNIVPGTGSITNGMFAGGLPGEKAGWYYNMPPVSWAPRVGFAWDVFGDGKTAIRAAGGIFYNFINRSQYLYNGGPLIASTRTVLNASIDDVQDIARAGTFLESPQTGNLPGGAPLIVHGNQMPQGKLQPEKNYQANVAFQKDIGFDTVAEVAWVGNFGRHFWRIKTGNNIPIYAYANPANLFRNEPINANFLRRDYPGLGQTRYLTTDDDILNYNAMQVSVQRRLHRGLQMGLAYTLSKAEGIQGWDFATEELYGKQGIRDRYYGPPSASQNQDRRHILVVHYSYAIPNPAKDVPILKQALDGWEAAGVTQFTTGNPLDPVCGTNLSGVANTDPSLTGLFIAASTNASNGRCELTGEPIFSGYTVDSSLPFEDQAHFNVNAFRRPLPNGSIGNFGNAPLGMLRHPSWWNWDFTLSRRLPVKVGRNGNLRIQIQAYNLWNQVQFTRLDATYLFTADGQTSPDTGKYNQTTNPRNIGITLRLDF
ncbi:MAG: carboxypeptidase regulatory-like domain-containing protein [Acidobacteria bacterium]|nr:carboxypeptidase regulatory-like domain-containing protein [Acidobacteriota bacterium]